MHIQWIYINSKYQHAMNQGGSERYIRLQYKKEMIRNKYNFSDLDRGFLIWVISVSGGGAKNFWSLGMINSLQDQKVKFVAASGTSSGSWVVYEALQTESTLDKILITIWNISNSVFPIFGTIVHADDLIHQLVTDMVNKEGVPSKELTLAYCHLNPDNLSYDADIYSEFENELDLIQCIHASSAIPGISAKYGMKACRGLLCIDGGIYKNNPKSYMKSKNPECPSLEIDVNFDNVFDDCSMVATMSDEIAEREYLDGYEAGLKLLEQYENELQNWNLNGRIHLKEKHATLKLTKKKIRRKIKKNIVADLTDDEESSEISDEYFESFFHSELSFDSYESESDYSSEGSTSVLHSIFSG